MYGGYKPLTGCLLRYKQKLGVCKHLSHPYLDMPFFRGYTFRGISKGASRQVIVSFWWLAVMAILRIVKCKGPVSWQLAYGSFAVEMKDPSFLKGRQNRKSFPIGKTSTIFFRAISHNAPKQFDL